jgi:hypothetical protein
MIIYPDFIGLLLDLIFYKTVIKELEIKHEKEILPVIVLNF